LVASARADALGVPVKPEESELWTQ